MVHKTILVGSGIDRPGFGNAKKKRKRKKFPEEIMATYRRIACLRVQPSDNNNRVVLTWVGPDAVERTYTVNQRILKRYGTAEEAKADLDTWTTQRYGYVLEDVWLHKNRDGITWAVATGASPPPVWPEDQVSDG